MATRYFYTQDGVILSELVLTRPSSEASWRELGGYPRTVFGVKAARRGAALELTDDTGERWLLTPLTDIDAFNAAARTAERDQYGSVGAAVAAYEASLEDQSTIARERADRFSYDDESFASLDFLQPAAT